MSERRSLSSAMEITPEKLAFIHGMKEPHDAVAAHEIKPGPPLESGELKERDSVQRTQHPKRARRQTERVQKVPQILDPAMLQGLLVPLTTRLQPQTADALRRAYLEQKLARKTPATQQEIVEAALQEWLRTHDYL